MLNGGKNWGMNESIMGVESGENGNAIWGLNVVGSGVEMGFEAT